MADSRGYFADEGIEVDFDYSLETDGVTLVASGDSPFALVSGEQVLLARAQGLPVVYVFTWFRDFPVGVAAPESAGWDSPDDMAGARIGIPGLFGASYIGYRALLSAAGLPDDAATLEAVGFNQVEVLLAGQEEAVVVYVNNEPVQLAARGLPVTVLRVADYVDLASNGLITSETMLREKPDQVRSMVRALAHGLQDTLGDPDRAFQISADYVPGLLEGEPTIQRQVLEASLDLWRADRVGGIDSGAWANMESLLIEMGLLAGPVGFEQATNDNFLP
jgi:NitT/TauT family transport system substrate-binding protein